MKKIVSLIAALSITITVCAQSAGDRLIGTYFINHDGEKSKVLFTKIKDNTYKCQVIWLADAKDEKGNLRLDRKNPDEKKRHVPTNQVVLIDKITYKDGIWKDGKIYDPTRGKYFNVELKFDDEETLAVKGMWAIFSQTIYWKKISD